MKPEELKQRCKNAGLSSDMLPSVIRKGYDFRFEFNGLTWRVGGSSVTGTEYVYVNDKLISRAKNRSMSSVHEFEVEGHRYRIEFQVLSNIKGSLVCRLYCNDELVRLFTAVPQHLPLIGPLFGAGVFFALLINDSSTIQVPLSFVLAFMGVLVVVEVVYAMRHIRIMELEVCSTSLHGPDACDNLNCKKNQQEV